MVYIFTFGAGEHGDGVAAVIFIEALGWAGGAAGHAWVEATAHHGVVVEARVELGILAEYGRDVDCPTIFEVKACFQLEFSEGEMDDVL